MEEKNQKFHEKKLTAIKGAIEHSTAPKIQSFLNAAIGVIVAEVKHTTRSEQLNEKMNIFCTVCSVLKDCILEI